MLLGLLPPAGVHLKFSAKFLISVQSKQDNLINVIHEDLLYHHALVKVLSTITQTKSTITTRADIKRLHF